MTSPSLVRLAAAALSVLLAACATTSKGGGTARQASDYWPLAVGHSWTYQVKHGGAVQEATVSIQKQDADGFFVDSQGARIKHHPAGLFDGDRFLLRDPVKLGTKWMAVPSANAVERFEIVSVGIRASVPAGIFDDCVLVRAVTRVDAERSYVGEWTYAPGVGMVHFVSRLERGSKAPVPQTEMSLIRFEPAPGS